MTDDLLAETFARMARGERAALRSLYTEAAPKLFGVCLRMLKDRGEAEDALQEIMPVSGPSLTGSTPLGVWQ